MPIASTAPPGDLVFRRRQGDGDAGSTVRALASAVAWGAIAAGAAAAAALSLILMILGVGLGLSSVSPWSHEGAGAGSFGVSTILWLTFTQLLASAVGGYMAGRLRTRWTDVRTDEVFFRDTAHGFLAWAVASLATATLLTSVIASILGGGMQAGVAASGKAVSTLEGGPMAYFVDSLFRREARPLPSGSSGPTPAGEVSDRALSKEDLEIGRIFMNAGGAETMADADLRHVGQLVAQRTGLSQQEAQSRVAATFTRVQARSRELEIAARGAADKARRVSAYGALWLFVSLLIGAFMASLAATYGGRQRDA